jgi:large subunit ribosomal protein L24
MDMMHNAEQIRKQVDVKVPAIYRSQSGLTTPFTAYPKPLLIKDIALVVPLRDRATRKVKDTVVKHLRGGAPFPKPTYGSATPRHTRYIAGHDIPIPWPEDETPEKKDEDSDTLRIDVDDVSFSPSVDHIPMPESLIDELRNKYSRTRKVHTEEYIQQKMKEDAEEQWKRRRRMVLPQQEYWEQKQKQKQQETLHNPKIMANTLSLITKEVQAARKGKKRLRVAL